MEAVPFINKYKLKILNIAVIVLALIIANNIHKAGNRAVALLEEKKETEIKKNAVLTSISQLEKKINLYKDFINKKDIDSVINTIGNIAKESQVKIVSLRPEKEKEESFYIVYPFVLTVDADNYHVLGEFISGLESHPDIYNVEQIAIREATGETENTKLTADLRVSTILLK